MPSQLVGPAVVPQVQAQKAAAQERLHAVQLEAARAAATAASTGSSGPTRAPAMSAGSYTRPPPQSSPVVFATAAAACGRLHQQGGASSVLNPPAPGPRASCHNSPSRYSPTATRHPQSSASSTPAAGACSNCVYSVMGANLATNVSLHPGTTPARRHNQISLNEKTS